MPYTPIFAGTSSVDLGNGTFTGSYLLDGKSITIQCALTVGTTTDFNGLTNLLVPVPPPFLPDPTKMPTLNGGIEQFVPGFMWGQVAANDTPIQSYPLQANTSEGGFIWSFFVDGITADDNLVGQITFPIQ